ncbi:MAG: NUDIX domain-containing protein [Candidatus Shapirobacteria bacterium]|jgi:ADP-ribose pyrophosphatase YjhB (NUDIX family)
MLKKPTKISDDLYYDERSAGGIVFKNENGKVLWLVIKTAANNKGRRIGQGLGKNPVSVYKFPKGHLKDNEFLKQAALREVEEEGGIKAEIITKIGSNNYIIWDKLQKRKIIKKVTFFLMEYREDSSLKHFDMELVLDRLWLPYQEAGDRLAYDSEKVLLGKAKYRLEQYLKTITNF